MLIVKNGHKRYPKSDAVIENLNLEVTNEKTALIGENGAGKTTLLKMIVGLIQPDEGQILIDEKDVYKNPILRRQIGYVPTESFFYEKLTVRENLELVGALFGADRLGEKILDLARKIEFDHFLDKKASDLSSGMKKKLALASGMIHNPRYLILDEPFNALDVAANALFQRILLDYKGGVLFTSHLPETVYQMADRIILLKGGTIHETVRKEEFDNLSAFSLRMNQLIKRNQA